MRRLELSDYMVPIRNEEGLAKFTAEKCKCGLDLSTAEPVDVRVKGRKNVSGKCPSCNSSHNLVIPETLDVTYSVKTSLVEMLLAKTLDLQGRELLERDKIAQKILDCPDGQILLEDEEWKKLVFSGENVKGVGRPEVELIKRIFGAEEVEVEEKKANP